MAIRPYRPKGHGNFERLAQYQTYEAGRKTRLKPIHIQEIRRLLDQGMSQNQVARYFTQEKQIPITQAMVSYIKNRKRWAKTP